MFIRSDVICDQHVTSTGQKKSESPTGIEPMTLRTRFITRFNTILLLKNRGKIAWYVWSPSFLRRLTLVLKSLNKVFVPPAAQFWFLLLYAAVFCPTFLFLCLFLCFCLNVNNLCVRDVFLRTHSNTDTRLTNTYTIAVADPHLQISGRGGGGGSSRPWDKGEASLWWRVSLYKFYTFQLRTVLFSPSVGVWPEEAPEDQVCRRRRAGAGHGRTTERILSHDCWSCFWPG